MRRVPKGLVMVAFLVSSSAFVLAPANAAVRAPSPLVTARKLTCVADVSNAMPKLNTTVYVLVHSQPRTHVVAHAYFKHHMVQKSSFTSKSGTSRIGVKVGQAAKGYKVNVTVNVAARGAVARCGTSFTPE